MKAKTWTRYALIVFYLVAGINHFIMPEFYYPLIPDYLPWKTTINVLSGMAEILLALGMIANSTRKWAAYGIIAILLAFIPAHVHFIHLGGCVTGGLCVPLWVAWVRLFPLHILLMAWAWWCR